MNDEKNLFTPSEIEMITQDGNIRKYIKSYKVELFNLYDVADLSFPNGYGKQHRVYSGYCPCLSLATIKNLCVKVKENE